MDPIFSFKAFLSHKYEYPQVNLYFFNLFNEMAEVQFELDAGKGSTNVTRLERMIRDADAFIGIYPFLGSLTGEDDNQQLMEQSKYFRLETELVVRSSKPAIIFYDKRYRDIIKPPENIASIYFDINEITGKGSSPKLETYRNKFLDFLQSLKLRKLYEEGLSVERNKIAIFVPPAVDNDGYTAACISKIGDLVAKKMPNADLEIIGSNAVLNIRQLRLLEQIDIALVDVGETMMQKGIPAYLHGRFVPMIRMHYQQEDAESIAPPLSNSFLFGGVEAGYPKDIVCWNNPENLLEKLLKRLDRINAGIRRINTPSEAIAYFTSAAIKDKSVFVSYTNADESMAADLIGSLKKRFKTVFNYKDTESIPGSEPWLDVIYDRIASCNVFIALYSKAYFTGKYEYCVQELKQGFTQKFNGRDILVYPVKLYKEEDLTGIIKDYAASIQYVRKYDFKSTDDLVEDIMKKLPD